MKCARLRAARIAHVRVDTATAVVERLVVALGTTARWGRSRARRVVNQAPRSVEVGAREAGVPAAVADVGARAVDLVELVTEQVVAAIERGLEPL
jgi:hypothetical protein